MASGPELSRNGPLAMYRTQTSQPGVQCGVLFELLYTLYSYTVQVEFFPLCS